MLAERPVGTPAAEHFRRDDVARPTLDDGKLLVRNLYLSIDPAQRGWVNADSNYSDPVAIGDVMRSLAVGVVEQTNAPDFAVGEYVYGWFGWQDCCAASVQQVLRRVDPEQAPLSAALGLIGINGLTAYLALVDIGRPKAGETVVVSTAAGAVGSLVGQIARRLGCHVVGITGSDAKVAECVDAFGYDRALNYKTGFDLAALKRACPDGVDVFFDNTSGTIADEVWNAMNVRGRIIQCGTAAIDKWQPPPVCPRRERNVLVNRLRHEGFIIFDYSDRFDEVATELAGWAAKGEIIYREHIEQGLDRAPSMLTGLFTGQNRGKAIVQLEMGD